MPKPEIRQQANGREDFAVDGTLRASANPAITLIGRHASGAKCARCWKYFDEPAARRWMRGAGQWWERSRCPNNRARKPISNVLSGREAGSESTTAAPPRRPFLFCSARSRSGHPARPGN